MDYEGAATPKEDRMTKFEKNVPLPDPKNKRIKIPFSEMKIGDSVFIPNPDGLRIRAGIYSQAKYWHVRIAVRLTDEGVRVFRVK